MRTDAQPHGKRRPQIVYQWMEKRYRRHEQTTQSKMVADII